MPRKKKEITEAVKENEATKEIKTVKPKRTRKKKVDETLTEPATRQKVSKNKKITDFESDKKQEEKTTKKRRTKKKTEPGENAESSDKKETEIATPKVVKNTKKRAKKKVEQIIATCLKNGAEMEVFKATEKHQKRYPEAEYELPISDTLAILKKSEVARATIKPLDEDMYYEINDELYHVEFYRNGRRIG